MLHWTSARIPTGQRFPMRYAFAVALLCTACNHSDPDKDREIAALKAQLAANGIAPAEAPPARADSVATRAEAAAEVVENYLRAEQTLGADRAQFFCHAAVVPGSYHNLMEWKVRDSYLHQKVAPPALPGWFKFTADIRATNGFGAPLTTTASYWVKRMPSGAYRIFNSCRHTECDSIDSVFPIWIGMQEPAVRAACNFPAAGQ